MCQKPHIAAAAIVKRCAEQASKAHVRVVEFGRATEKASIGIGITYQWEAQTVQKGEKGSRTVDGMLFHMLLVVAYLWRPDTPCSYTKR